MGKLFFLNFFVVTFLIFIIVGCQSRQQKGYHNNLAEVSQELREKIINEIYDKKDNLQLCEGDIDESLSSKSSSIYKLNNNEYLVEILCFFGAYQGNYQYFFYKINNLQSKISPLYFQEFSKNKNNDFKVKNSINIGGIPDYNEENKILTVKTKGRGLDDCGSLAKYQWQESQFELLEYRVKDKCDGNYLDPENYPKIYP
jgi:hypothetical protein